MHPGKIAAVGALASWLVFALPALAQDATSAQALFDEGRRLMEKGNLADACPKLAASQRLDPGAGTLLNLARCYDKGGQTASAWATYKLAAAASKPGHPDWEASARDRATQLEAGLSRLTIVVPAEANVPGLVIERDGRAVEQAEWGTEMPVDPGVHPVEASAPKKQRWSTTVSVAPNGAHATITIPALAAGESRPGNGDGVGDPALAMRAQSVTGTGAGSAADRGDKIDGSGQRRVGLVVAGAGVVGLGIGVVFGLLAKSSHDDALTHCSADRRCTAQGISLGDTATTRATVSTGAFIAGGVLLAGGLALYFVSPRAGVPATAIRVTPIPGGAAAAAGGAW